MSLYFDYEFDAIVSQHDVGSDRYRYTVVFVPDEISNALPLDEFPRLRITGEVNDYPLEAALTPVRGDWYILLSKKLLNAIGTRVDEYVTVRFSIADQSEVSVPDALYRALAKNHKLQALWEQSTPGKQRSLAYLVSSAKRADTQAKRVELVFDVLLGKRDIRGNPTGKA